MDPKTHVHTHINGEPVEFLSEAYRSLLEILRDELMLTGTKEGCTTGDCGACSVTLDGRLVCSCLVLAVEAEGRRVGTVEGIARGETRHPGQQKLLEHAALDSYWTPGVSAGRRLGRFVELRATYEADLADNGYRGQRGRLELGAYF